jgi:hypothetical protein
MQSGDGYLIAGRDELERAGNWALVRRSVGCHSFGVNLFDIPAGESTPEHDETARDQLGADRVGADDQRLRADGVGVNATIRQG